MKTWNSLTPRGRKVVAALGLLAAFVPTPIGLALQHIAAVAIVTATVLLLRSHPSGSHRTLTTLRLPHPVATVITGHKPAAPAADRTVAHAPVNGPAIPLNNPTR